MKSIGEDWDILKSAIVEKKRAEKTKEETRGEIKEETRGEIKEVGVKGEGFILNKTDLAVIELLLGGGRVSLMDLREYTNRSRVSVYLSIRRLKRLSLVEEGDHFVELRRNLLVDAISRLLHENFPLEKLSGERLLVLQSLVDWKTPDQVAVECGISPPSVYRYLRELKPFTIRGGRQYKIGEGNRGLIEFLEAIKNRVETGLGTSLIWSSPDGRLLKTRGVVDGSLTAFSRFPDFGVDFSSDHFYYYVPRKKLSVSEIFIHSLRCLKDDKMLPKITEFYVKNAGEMDVFSIDELALEFKVVDPWLDFQARLVDTGFGKVDQGDDSRLYYLSPENIFLSRSFSNTLGAILECEGIMRREELSWDIIFHEYVLYLKDGDFRWRALLSRLQILEHRTGGRISILRKLTNRYIENAIMRAVKNPKTISELREELNIPEYQIRNIVSRLVRNKSIRKMDTKPLEYAINISS